jgi:hypothetical protein
VGDFLERRGGRWPARWPGRCGSSPKVDQVVAQEGAFRPLDADAVRAAQPRRALVGNALVDVLDDESRPVRRPRRICGRCDRDLDAGLLQQLDAQSVRTLKVFSSWPSSV